MNSAGTAGNWKRSLARQPNLFAGLLLLAGLLGIALLLQARRQTEAERIRLETAVTAEQVALRIGSCFSSRASIVDSLGRHRWLDQAQLRAQWQQLATALFPLYRSILALNYVDNDGIIREVFPEAGNAAAVNADLRQNSNPSVPRAVAEAMQTDALVRSDVIELLQSGKGVAFYRRILAADGTPLGLVNGAFRLNEVLGNCLGEAPLRDRFVFQLSEDATGVFYRQPAEGLQLQTDHVVTLNVDIPGQPWRLDFSPSASMLAAGGASLDVWWGVFAVALVSLLSLALRSLLMKQQHLQQSRQDYRLLVENQTDMVVKVTPAGEFLYVSPSYCRVFGKQQQELLGRQFLPLVHEEDRERTRRSLQSLTQPPYQSYHEQRALTQRGWRWLAWTNMAVLDDDGRIDAITAVGRDVTDIKQLEMRVAHAQKMQAIGQMAGGISHDFNNLLQVMLGSVEYLRQQRPHDRVLQSELSQLGEAIERAMQLIARLAALGRSEPSARETIELNSFIGSVQTSLQRVLPPAITLTVVPAERPLYVDADRTQLEQVLLNLGFNARDAIDGEGCIVIRIDEHEMEPSFTGDQGMAGPRRHARIRVTDNGSGMSAEVQARVFEPFFTTKPAGKGTGLGLANCYGIISRHHGDIAVSSVPAQGTEFTILLPLTNSEGGSP